MSNNLFYIPNYNPNPLFGSLKKQIPSELFYIYQWIDIEANIVNGYGNLNEFFLEESLSDFREQFLSTAQKSWSNITGKLITEEIGSMPIDWKNWLINKVFPILPDIHNKLTRIYQVYSRQTKQLRNYTIKNIHEILDDIISYNRHIQENILNKAYNPHLKIKKIHFTGSDRHNHGRSVVIIEYNNGDKVLWKPRSMKLATAWSNWLDFLCNLSGRECFPHIKCFDTKNGSFCNFIEHIPLNSKSEISDYFQNAGLLLAASFLLQGADFHAENIIAHGKFPIIIDTETVIYVSNPISDIVHIPYSIEQSAFLPFITSGSGLYPGPSSFCCEKYGNNNLPVFDGKKYSAYEYKDDVISGFREAVMTCYEHLDLAADTAARLFLASSFRYILKSTKFYYTLLNILSNPNNMLTEETHMSALDRLNHWVSPNFDKRLSDIIINTEKKSLSEMDIPAFYFEINEENIHCLRESILSLTEDIIAKNISTIDFILSKPSVKTSALLPTVLIKNNSLEDIRPTAEYIMKTVANNKAVIVQRDDLNLYITHLMAPMLEGSMGSAIALQLWSKLTGDVKAKDLVARHIDNLNNREFLFSSSITSLELGLCEGLGGFTIGLNFFFKEGIILKEIYDKYLDKIAKIDLLKSKNDYSLCYGKAGAYYALRMTPANIIKKYSTLTSQLETIKSHMTSIIKEKTTDNDLIRGKKGIDLALGNSSFEELFPKDDTANALINNIGLINGLSGKLYAATTRRINLKYTEADEYEKLCATALLSANKPDCIPDVCLPGLIYGHSGKLYSYLRYIDPDAIPSLFI